MFTCNQAWSGKLIFEEETSAISRMSEAVGTLTVRPLEGFGGGFFGISDCDRKGLLGRIVI